ncbi:MAG: MerR family transcriptional regulator, partial [Clostridia bacterium]|nr:MerR family transcriptional regulator [Clostridia bacterium]
MRISDVEKQTGVTRKTIRFYEAKGLLTVSRSLNSYRDYDETVVSEIRQIIVLRKAGVGLSDIQLWRNQVISYPEMINKRLYELRNEADTASDQISLCRTLLDDGLEQAVGQHYHETFTEVVSSAESDAAGDLSIGIDIGTTTISAAVLSLETARAVSTYTINSEAGVEGSRPWERMQDAEKILDRVEKL